MPGQGIRYSGCEYESAQYKIKDKNRMKVITGFIMAVFLTVGLAGVATAAEPQFTDKAKTVEDAGTQIREDIRFLMNRFNGISQANRAIKEAGLSYQKALVADTATTSAYTSEKQQALMAGVYTFDATYAALFLKKRELAATLKARKVLGEKLGFGMALPPKMKKLMVDPESITDFESCAEAFDELLDKLVTEQLTTDQRLVTLVDGAYGAVTEGLYVVTESIAQAGYPEEMIDLMDQQLVRVNFMILLINIFEGKQTFEQAVALAPRLKVLESIKGLMESRGVSEPSSTEVGKPPFVPAKITRAEIDQIRSIVTPLRKNILTGKV